MATYTWSSNGSGSWGNVSNWGTSLPTDLDIVIISVPGAQVTVDPGVSAYAYTLTTTGSSLLLDGGRLVVEQHATFDGAYTQISGTLVTGGTGATFYGATSLAGGSINVATGSLQIENGAVLGGGSINGTATTLTMTGAGVLELAGGSTYVDAGFSCKLNAIQVDYGAKLGFNTSFSYAHSIIANGASVDLFGHSLTLTGNTLFSGVLGSGTLLDAGTLTLGSTGTALTLDNGLVLDVTGTAIQAYTIYQSANDSGAKIAIGKTGHYDINGNWSVYDPATVATLNNKGVFAKTGGGGLSVVNTSLASTGTLQAGIGELQLNGLVNSVAGTVSGAGTLGIAGGQTTLAGKVVLNVAAIDQHSGLLVLNNAQTYANEWEMSGGVLNLNAPACVFTLTGNDSFDGGLITGYGGTLNFNGTTELSNVMLGGPNHFNFNGPIDQTGTVTFGSSSNPTGTIAAGSSWQIEGDSSIQGAYGLLINKGTFSDINGSGDAQVYCELSSTGTVAANNSTLTLAGTSWLGGTLTGTGLLDLAGTTVLQSGLAINVAALDVAALTTLGGNLSDAGVFTEYYYGEIDTAGHTLALSGTVSLDQGSVTDLGTITSAGQTTIGYYTVTGGAELLIGGHADQNAALSLQDSSGTGTLGVASGAIYTVLDDLNINGAGNVVLHGTLNETGTGDATIASTLTLWTSGVLAANDQMLTLGAGGTLNGTLTGSGTINLGGGSFTLASGLSVLSAGLEVSGAAAVALSANQSFAGDFQTTGSSTLTLGGDTLTLTGTAELSQGTINGPGVLVAAGTTALGAISLSGNGTLQVTGTAEQVYGLQLGSSSGTASTAELVIGKTGSYTLDAGASISGDGTLVVSGGSLVADGNGYSAIQGNIVDAGTIAANLGTLVIQGSITATGVGTGIFSIGTAGFLDFSSTATVGVFTGVNFTGASGLLRVDDLAGFGATIQNFASGDAIQISGLTTSMLSETYANAAHTALLLTDGSNDQITLQFSSAQTLSALTLGAGTNGVATLTHH